MGVQFASMAEGFMHRTLNPAIRVRVLIEVQYRGSSVVVAYKAHNLSGGVQLPLPQLFSFKYLQLGKIIATWPRGY